MKYAPPVGSSGTSLVGHIEASSTSFALVSGSLWYF